MFKFKFKKRILNYILACFILIILTLPIVMLQFIIPSNMKFLLGQEHNLDYFLPIDAQLIMENDEEIALVNQNPISSQKDIQINKPFSVTFNKLGDYHVQLKLFGVIPLKQMKVNVIEPYELIPCGRTIGVEMSTDGILVLGIGSVQGVDGTEYDPSKGRLFTGDLIIEANGQYLNNEKKLIEIIEQSNGQSLDLKINRYGSYKNVVVEPIQSLQDNKYKLGIWVRDDAQGIGTITYINPKNKIYGALGHGITDIDTKELMSLKDGKITDADIISITKGEKGTPGEIEGVILKESSHVIGDVRINTEEGIFGKISNGQYDLLQKQPMEIALQQDVIEGSAIILTDISGKTESYDVQITKVTNFNQSSSKGMIVEIVDKDLLSKTNGIIQGMSGSPIIQNGKLIGAVTHVFVQNPTKGYGIYIENMIKKERLIEE